MKLAFLDSGIGGLTVLEAFYKHNPSEQSKSTDEIIYLADLANLPYGDKSSEQLIQILLSNLHWLQAKKTNVVVLACNTSSSLLNDSIRRLFPNMQILGLIDSLVASLKASWLELKNVAVFCTEATHRLGAYKSKILEVLPDATVFSVACPKLVPLIEAWVDSPDQQLEVQALPILDEYISKLPCEPQALVFGCTHYPLLKQYFHKLLPCTLLIDPAEAIVHELKDLHFADGHSSLKAYSSAHPVSPLRNKLASLKEILNCAKYFSSEVEYAPTADKIFGLKSIRS